MYGPGIVTILSSLALFRLSWADCECGYSVITGDSSHADVFTDLLESDFVHVHYFDSKSSPKGWAAQAYNMTAYAAHGSYGESFVTASVGEHLIGDINIWTGQGADGGDAGVTLVVNHDTVNGMVQGGQVATTDGEFFHGSYRASLKITAWKGTCTAFFWYFNDTQEIDMEFLSREFNATNSSYPVNLVLQSRQSAAVDYDASRSGTFIKANLPFDPTAGFHEYRFDFLPSRVLFFADGSLLASMNDSTGAVPSTAGSLMLSHWSNGNDGWSGGPPAQDAVSVVRYVKAYYNSSSPARKSDFAARCEDPGRAGAVCDVPEGNATFFFTYQSNMTVNQSTYSGLGSGSEDASNKGNGVVSGGSGLLTLLLTFCITLAMVM